VEQALNDAITSIHTYRDALVEDGQDAGIQRVVDAAYVITPYMPGVLPDGYQGAPSPSRFFHPKYRSTFQFGALTMVPGMRLSEVREMLRLIMDDAAGAPTASTGAI